MHSIKKEYYLQHIKLIFKGYLFVKTQLNKQSFGGMLINGSTVSKSRFIFNVFRRCQAIFKLPPAEIDSVALQLAFSLFFLQYISYYI